MLLKNEIMCFPKSEKTSSNWSFFKNTDIRSKGETNKSCGYVGHVLRDIQYYSTFFGLPDFVGY